MNRPKGPDYETEERTPAGRGAAVIAGIVVSSGIPAYAARWDIADGDITVKAGDEGTNKVTGAEGGCGGTPTPSSPASRIRTPSPSLIMGETWTSPSTT